jgi:hypothetical protein
VALDLETYRAELAARDVREQAEQGKATPSARPMLALQSEATIERRIVARAAGLPVTAADVAAVVATLTADGVTHAPTVDVAPALPEGPSTVPGLARNVADIGDAEDWHQGPARPWHTAPAHSYPARAVPSGRTTVPLRHAPRVSVKRKTFAIAGTVTSAERRSMLHRCSCDRDSLIARARIATGEHWCQCVQSYPVLDGAPVGSVETLAASLAEAAARANDEAWEARNKYAESPEPMTRQQRKNAARKAARARKVAP